MSSISKDELVHGALRSAHAEASWLKAEYRVGSASTVQSQEMEDLRCFSDDVALWSLLDWCW